MKKMFSENTKYRTGAVALSLLHVPIVLVIVFGYLLNGFLSYFYFALLVVTLFSWIFLGYCPITKWEFDIRSKYMKMPKYNYEYLHFWGHKYLHINLSVKKIRFYSIVFLVISIITWILVHI